MTMLDGTWVLLIGIYIGMGLVMFLFLNPKMATKFISKILPELIVEQIRTLFQDEEFVREIFTFSHAHLKETMMEGIHEELTNQGQAVVDRVKDSIEEQKTGILEGVAKAMTEQVDWDDFNAVLDEWAQRQREMVGKMKEEAMKQIPKAIKGEIPEGIVPLDKGALVGLISNEVFGGSDLANYVLSMAMQGNGGGGTQISQSTRYPNRGGY